MLSADQFRSHFPIFEDGVHLCSCSEGALSDRVMVAMSEFMTSWRIHGAPWERWMEEVDSSRKAFAQLIGANSEDVAVVSCASEGAFQVAEAETYAGERNGILTNDMEFPSIAHVWLGQQSRGAQVHFVPQENGMVSTRDYLSAIDETMALVSVPLVSYANGLRLPVRAITDRSHEMGARVVVDAYQGAGVVPIDVQDLGCDYLIAGSLKYLLGAPGIAFLWVKPELQQETAPRLTGWFGRLNPFAFDPHLLDYAPSARRFQTGTPSIPAAFAATAGLSLIHETDVSMVYAHVENLASRLQAGLTAQGWPLLSPADPAARGPQVAVVASDAEQVADFLVERRIFASPRGNAVRLSLHYYNNVDDVDRAIGALGEYRSKG